MSSSKTFLFLTGVILVFGLIVLSSAGVAEGQNKFGQPQYYFYHQLLFGLLPGIIAFLLLGKVPYKFWQKISLPLLIGAIALLVAVLLPSYGHYLKGAQRWLRIGAFSFQPSELLKLSVIIYLAAWFSRKGTAMKHWTYSAVPFFVIIIFLSFLLAAQPDIGTLSVVLLIAFGMYFAGGAKFKHILVLLVILGIFLGALVYFEPYQLDRILTFINPSKDPQGSSYHIRQAKLGLGSGGLFGRGFGNSQQKINYLPEPVGDSIFVILTEELGLVGASFLLLLFVLLSLNMTRIAIHAPDEFSRLFVVGVLIWIMGQAFMNISAISGLMPLTGVPLPFVSYGGTALASILGSLGIVYNIAKQQRI